MCFLAHDHSETSGAALTFIVPGNENDPVEIICVNRAGSVPPVLADLRTTAQISTSTTFSITILGTFLCYGVIFSAGTTTNGSLDINGSNRTCRFINCELKLNNNNSGSEDHLRQHHKRQDNPRKFAP